MAKVFAFEELVWARMKHFPLWPAKIVEPTTEVKSKDKKHYVFFFGTEDYAWIADKNILPHSKELLDASKSYLKPKPSLKAAIERIEIEAAKLLKTKAPKTKPPSTASGSGSDSASKKSSKTPSKKSPKQSAYKSLESPKKPVKAAGKSSKLASAKLPKALPGKVSRKGRKKPKPSLPVVSGSSKTPLLSSGVCKMQGKGKKRSFPNINVTVRSDPPPPPKIMKMDDDDDLEELAREATNIAVVLPLDPFAPREGALKATDKKIGFIGLGMMGQRVVTQLINSGHDITVYNRTIEKCQRFADAGAKIADHPADMLSTCDIIFSCVAGQDAANEIAFGRNGILEGLERCRFNTKGFVDLSSVDPFTAEKISEAVNGKGGRYLNAVISGSLRLAEEGRLLILGSGSRPLFNECDTCFFAFSRNAYFYNNIAGYSCKVNLIVNMFLNTANVALAEALSLIEHCNLQMENLLEIFELSPLGNRMMMDKGSKMQRQEFVPADITLKHQQEDLRQALEMGSVFMQPLQISSIAHEVLQKAKKDNADDDISAIINVTK